MAEFIRLRDTDELRSPQDDVLKRAYTPWDAESEPVVKMSKGNKMLFKNEHDKEFIFVTPAVKVTASTVNRPSGIEVKHTHRLRISKIWPPPWTLGQNCLPYAPTPKPNEWFSKLETIVKKALKLAFDTPGVFTEATEKAWSRVNMESATKEIDAWNVFLSEARLPFDNDYWHIKKTTKTLDSYVTLVDIDNVEHTGNVDIMTSAIVSVGIRLWPYHMSGDVYGVSASFADTGIKFYYTGPMPAVRNHIDKRDTCLVKCNNKAWIYDVFGQFYTFQVDGKLNGTVLETENDDFLEEFEKFLIHLNEQGIGYDGTLQYQVTPEDTISMKPKGFIVDKVEENKDESSEDDSDSEKLNRMGYDKSDDFFICQLYVVDSKLRIKVIKPPYGHY